MMVFMFHRSKRGLIALFEKVYELRRDPVGRRMLALDIQEELFRRVTRAERRVRSLRDENRSLKAKLATRGLDRDEARALKQNVTINLDHMDEAKHHLQLCRDVGDAVGFIYANRWDVKPLSNREHAGLLTGKRGARLERAVLREVFRLGKEAILNDLTNSFRFGDITVFLGEGVFSIMEVKSGRGGNKSRAERQKEAIDGVLGYINTDERNLDGGLLIRRAPPCQASYHVDTINRLLSIATQRGWVHEEVEHGLHYFIIDGEDETPMDEVLSALVSCRPMLIFVNNQKYTGCSYFPFLLSFEDPETAFKFYSGETVILVAVDMNHVANVLASRDFKLHITGEPNWPWEIEWLGAGKSISENNRIKVGGHIIGRLGAEFLSLEWLLQYAIHTPFSESHSSSV
jgi:hypothetical protein